MHAGGTAHLSHPADGFLHLLGRYQHQVGQLVDNHHHAGQLLQILPDCRQLVEFLQLLHAVFREGLVPLHHLKHGPLQSTGRFLRVRHHRDQQVGNPIVGRQLHHFGVHHDEANLLRGGLVKQTDNQGVGTHGLTGAGGTGNEYMGQFFDVADDIPAADIPPHRKGRFRGMLHKFSGLDNVPDQH